MKGSQLSGLQVVVELYGPLLGGIHIPPMHLPVGAHKSPVAQLVPLIAL